MAKLDINGRTRDVQVEASTPLLWVIREQVGLTGTKFGCGIAQCGACSVHLNGEVVRSCSMPLSSVKSTDKIVTIEGLSPNASHPVQKAWLALDVPQCGYLLTGQIMAVNCIGSPARKHACRQIGAALAGQAAEGNRPGHRRRDDHHLPLRDLPAHPGRRARGLRPEQRLRPRR